MLFRSPQNPPKPPGKPVTGQGSASSVGVDGAGPPFWAGFGVSGHSLVDQRGPESDCRPRKPTTERWLTPARCSYRTVWCLAHCQNSGRTPPRGVIPPLLRRTTRANGIPLVLLTRQPEPPGRTESPDAAHTSARIRVAASFPGRRGGCQGSNLFEPEGPRGALDTHHVD